MVHVFVTGASGYIGNAVALALRRAGHHVTGLVRSQEKADKLVQQEIVPVIGDVSKPETYRDAAAKASVLIHAAFDLANFEVTETTAVETLLAVTAASSATPKSKRVILTSGCLVYGNHPHGATSEETPTTGAHPFLQGRVARENKVLSHPTVAGVVIRSSFVYGGHQATGSYLKSIFNIEANKVTVKGTESIGYSLVHVEDLAELYVRVVEAPIAVVAGEAFNGADDSRTTNRQVGLRIGELLKVPASQVVVSQEGAFPPMLITVYVSIDKARRSLGWIPQRPLLLDELPLYLGSFLGKSL